MEILTPGVEHGQQADPGPEMLGVGRDLKQCFGGCAEEQVINELLILQRQRR